MNQQKLLKLASFLYPTGYHVAAWRHPAVPPDAGINFQHFADLARLSERGKLDFLFLADSLAVRGTDLDALSRTALRYVAQFEPLTLLAGLAAVTRRIGLVATATTSYNEPFHIARKFASLDHISGGRAGWNLVTSQNEHEAQNFGRDDHLDHARRYELAREFVTVVKGLWDSWEPDAFPRDKASGLFFDPRKLHVLDHRGKHFKVRGPLNVPRSPQGQPVIVQAGSSSAGRNLAAATAEVVFTAQHDVDEARAFYADVKRRVRAAGRHEDDVQILVGIFPYVGSTQREAIARRDELQSLIDPVVGLSLLQGLLGPVDLASLPLDGPLPELPETNAGKSRRDLLAKMARDEGMSIRDLYLHVAGGRGHLELVGDPASVADAMETWFRGKAADGFIIMAPDLPDGLHRFVDLVIPELQRRGLARRSYEGSTLREHLGLSTPVSPVTASAPDEEIP